MANQNRASIGLFRYTQNGRREQVKQRESAHNGQRHTPATQLISFFVFIFLGCSFYFLLFSLFFLFFFFGAKNAHAQPLFPSRVNQYLIFRPLG